MDVDKDAMHFLFGHTSLDEHFNDQGGSLSGNEIQKVYDSDVDFADIPHPLDKFMRHESVLAKSSPVAADPTWDEPLTVSTPLEKSFTNPLGFTKWSMGYRLGIVRVEEKEINGERWSRAYNQAGELVEARVIE
jgi:hypothetical protein